MFSSASVESRPSPCVPRIRQRLNYFQGANNAPEDLKFYTFLSNTLRNREVQTWRRARRTAMSVVNLSMIGSEHLSYSHQNIALLL